GAGREELAGDEGLGEAACGRKRLPEPVGERRDGGRLRGSADVVERADVRERHIAALHGCEEGGAGLPAHVGEELGEPVRELTITCFHASNYSKRACVSLVTPGGLR